MKLNTLLRTSCGPCQDPADPRFAALMRGIARFWPLFATARTPSLRIGPADGSFGQPVQVKDQLRLCRVTPRCPTHGAVDILSFSAPRCQWSATFRRGDATIFTTSFTPFFARSSTVTADLLLPPLCHTFVPKSLPNLQQLTTMYQPSSTPRSPPSAHPARKGFADDDQIGS